MFPFSRWSVCLSDRYFQITGNPIRYIYAYDSSSHSVYSRHGTGHGVGHFLNVHEGTIEFFDSEPILRIIFCQVLTALVNDLVGLLTIYTLNLSHAVIFSTRYLTFESRNDRFE